MKLQSPAVLLCWRGSVEGSWGEELAFLCFEITPTCYRILKPGSCAWAFLVTYPSCTLLSPFFFFCSLKRAVFYLRDGLWSAKIVCNLVLNGHFYTLKWAVFATVLLICKFDYWLTSTYQHTVVHTVYQASVCEICKRELSCGNIMW